MSNHTPGPWYVSAGGVVSCGPVPMNPLPATRTGVFYMVSAKDQCAETEEADRRLIASAPELLTALEVMVDQWACLAQSGDAGNWDHEDDDCVKRARAAIKKARQG